MAVLFLSLGSSTALAKSIPTALPSYEPWPEEAVDLFRKLLVQDGGRVKPVDTYARFTQLAFIGKRSVEFSTADGEEYKIDSAEWLLNVLFRPQVAIHLPTFVVDDSRAIEDIGLTPKSRRDRYSYQELFEARAKLAEKAQQYAQQQQKFEAAKERQSDEAAELELDRVQTMVLILARNVSAFEYLGGQMTFAQEGDILSETLLPPTMKTLARNLDTMELIERLPPMTMDDLMRAMQAGGGADQDSQLISMSLQLLFFYARSGDTMALFPPPRQEYPRLTSADILKPKALAEKLSSGDKVDALSIYLWGRMDEATRTLLADPGTDEAALRDALRDGLNAILEGELIFEEKRFAAGSVEKPTRDLMKTEPEGETLVELNRMLLNDYYRTELETRKEEWLTVGEVITLALGSEEMRPWARERLGLLQKMVQSSAPGQEESFVTNLQAFEDFVGAEAELRREGGKAPTEVGFYQQNYFGKSLIYFTLAFVVLALSWLSPGSTYGRWARYVTIAITLVALGYLCTGITMRCIIRGRPPITNLYETIIFIAAICVIVGLFAEWVTRLGVGLVAAVVSGVALMFLSIRYEAMEATDTMGQLIAVLDTNFWLATHVTIINIGYAAGMLAAIVSHFWIVGKMIGVGGDGKNFSRTVTRMVYGIVCFCLLFSLVGTVLGGIWANDSWGRFWGWDPKENGALMICLFALAILHARMGGYIRELGIHLSSIFLGMIVTFSWWGVNNLGVGLHSYGFTEGVWKNLLIFYGIEIVFMILAVVAARGGGRKVEPASSGPVSGKPGVSAEAGS